MQSNLFNTLMLLGSLQGFILAWIFWRATPFQKKSNTFLALLIFVVSLQNLSNALIDMGWLEIEYFPMSFTLLIPVALYFFVAYLVEPNYQFTRRFYWFLLPFFLQFVFRIIVLVAHLGLPDWSPTLEYGYVFTANAFETLSIFISLAVLVNGIYKINHFEKQLMSNFSSIEDRSLQWLRKTLFAFLGLWILWAIPFSILLIKGSRISFYPLWTGLSLITYWLAYSIYIRKDIFEVTNLTEASSEKNTPTLSENTEEHYKKLLHLIEVEKLYQMPTLSMSILAEKLNLSKGYLSKIINQKEGKNFFDFINSYRVEEAKKKMQDPKFNHYSLLGIGLDAGFSSKSTFNAVFKKMTGMTPSTFKKSLKI